MNDAQKFVATRMRLQGDSVIYEDRNAIEASVLLHNLMFDTLLVCDIDNLSLC